MDEWMEVDERLGRLERAVDVERRRFLAAAGAPLLALPFAGLLARFARGAEGDDDPELLPAAVAAARAAGKPLLVLLVPAWWPDGRRHGEHLGVWLEFADRRTLVDLAHCEVACATATEVERAGLAPPPPDAVGADPGPAPPPAWMLLVETAVDPPRTARIAPPASPWEPPRPVARGNWDVESPSATARAELSASLHAALFPSAESRAERADQSERSLDDTTRGNLARALAAGEEIEPRMADRAAAALAFAAPAEREESLLEAIAEGARARLLRSPPRGALWAESTVCGGLEYVDRDGSTKLRWSAPCGTAHVPMEGRRFLYFYTRDPQYGAR